MRGNPLIVDRRQCVRARFWRSTCTRCRDVCPHRSLSLDDGAPEVGEGCTACGLCAAVCPTGAIDCAEDGEKALYEEVRGRAKAGAHLVFTCRMGPSAPDRFPTTPVGPEDRVTVPCLGRLGEHHLLAGLAHGARAVSVGTVECAGCTYAAGGRFFQGTLERARVLGGCDISADGFHPPAGGDRSGYGTPHAGARSGAPRGTDDVAGVPFTPLKKQASVLTRREFFSFLRPRLSEDAPRRESDVLHDRGRNVKRDILLEVLRLIPGGEGLRHGVLSPGGAFGDVEVSRECFGCTVCERLCPTNAILRGEIDDDITLFLDPKLCTACGVCAEACLPRAMTVRVDVEGSVLRSTGYRDLTRLKKRLCRTCGEEFGAPPDDSPALCPGCRKREGMAAQWRG